MLSKHCFVNDNIEDNVFVGVECTADGYSISFPLGYRQFADRYGTILVDEEDAREDILLLLSVLQKFTNKEESKVVDSNPQKFEDASIPIQAYLYVIKDFLYRGYYKETEVIYCHSKKGKINWSRTIKQIKPVIYNNDIVYLDFITKKNTVNENELVTLIHQYCVYIAFKRIGWLFGSFDIPKPSVTFNKKLFVAALMNKLANTFNDQNKTLFRNLLAIVEERSDNSDSYEFRFGTTSFHTVWEKMINRVYGIDELEKYYPHAMWDLGFGDLDSDGGEIVASELRPDSIMVPNKQDLRKVFVLDAKYYKYGDLRYRDEQKNIHYMNTPSANRLPHSADINKQITYGEYIAEIENAPHGEKLPLVYNAFVLPFDSSLEYWHNKKQEQQFLDEPPHLHWVGEAKSNWKKNNKPYERVQAILLDVKHIMQLNVKQDEDEIMVLAKLIEDKCQECLMKEKK